MVVEEATVTEKGQITIPKRIREEMGLEKGSKVSFRIRNDEIVMYPKVEEPLEKLRDLRETVSFSDHEIEEMIKDSKESWSQHQ